MKVKYISMCLSDREIGRVYEDRIVSMVPPGPFAPDIRQWYDDSFYRIPDSDTFEARYRHVTENCYMCFSKPALKMYACEVDFEADDISDPRINEDDKKDGVTE